MLSSYRQHVAERAALGIPPLPLTAQQTAEVIELLKQPPAGEEGFLLDLITHRVPAGVDDAANVKASYLAAVAFGTEASPLLSRERATELLGDAISAAISRGDAARAIELIELRAGAFDALGVPWNDPRRDENQALARAAALVKTRD